MKEKDGEAWRWNGLGVPLPVVRGFLSGVNLMSVHYNKSGERGERDGARLDCELSGRSDGW